MHAMDFEKRSGKNNIRYSKKYILICQEANFCGPERESCVKNQTLKDKSCLVSCEGLYADISDDSFKQNVLKGWQFLKM